MQNFITDLVGVADLVCVEWFNGSMGLLGGSDDLFLFFVVLGVLLNVDGSGLFYALLRI